MLLKIGLGIRMFSVGPHFKVEMGAISHLLGTTGAHAPDGLPPGHNVPGFDQGSAEVGVDGGSLAGVGQGHRDIPIKVPFDGYDPPGRGGAHW